ncbi:MAG: tetratricopeptide repeat protein, partial [Rhodospirillales bacterium]|nr:tetratricopeptide repeat protein [Rhodospirillales bacterium]
FDDAIAGFERAIALGPATPEMRFNLGEARRAAGHLAEAADIFYALLKDDDKQGAVHDRLAQVLAALGRLDQALYHFAQAAVYAPSASAAHNVATALQKLERIAEAEHWYRQAIEIDPAYAPAYDNLGTLLQLDGRLDESAQLHEKAIALDPNRAGARVNLANALMAEGRIPGALAALRWAMMMRPDDPVAHQNLLMGMNYDETCSAASLAAESRRWGDRFGGGLAAPSYGNGTEAERGLRVGFVSADFRRHSVAYFLEPALEALAGDRITSVLYSDVTRPDGVTQRLQKLAQEWRDLAGVSDHALAELVRKDGIDILVDLSGHTAGNRLLAFARAPAPVQLSWLGYPATTGLAAIGWRLTDGFADPEGMSEADHSERLYRLPGFLCDRPDADAPEPSPLPALPNGHVTFGSFNALAKLSERDVGLMAAILKKVAGSKLLLKARPLADPGVKKRVIERFARHAIEPERLELIGRAESIGEHLGLYGRIDVALDPVHYNGTTTTCEALWMGVPVVTLAGNRHASRVGASLLSRANLKEDITASDAAYVERAAQLAGDLDALANRRASLRAALKASPLLDAPAFGRHLEQAFRAIWKEWCRS